MAKKKIVSVECEIPGGLSERVDIESTTSLLDWDVILFNPDLDSYLYSYNSYQGKPSLKESDSFEVRAAANHWRREISDAVRAGKTVFIFLPKLQEVFVDTGKRQYSGTGRNRQATEIVAPFSNYRFLPLDIQINASEGKEIKLTKEGDILADYWREFSNSSVFKVLISGKIGTPLLVTKAGAKTVGSIIHKQDTGGALVMLPFIDLDSEEFYEEASESSPRADGEETDEEDFVWTESGKVFGHTLLKSLLGIDKTLKQASAVTPQPEWAGASVYMLPQEGNLHEELLKIEGNIEELAEKREEVKTKLVQEGALRRLLYEKGHPLEMAIISALRLMGFHAEHYRDPQSEFDVVFECEEGRLLGEAEGKDNKSVSVDKLRQLEMNIHEDFAREEVTDIAKGVLFGNAHRLKPLDQRGDFFTQKCMTAAKRSGTALVRTPDLFQVAQYLSNGTDDEFAKKCRASLLSTNGEVVVFPEIPGHRDKT